MGITPACAGNSCPFALNPPIYRDHPRLRGEQPIMAAHVSALVGSPPLARGTADVKRGGNQKWRITPACAGNRERGLFQIPSTEDHPRLRGEQMREREQRDHVPGSPPLARGTGGDIQRKCDWDRITPACAGNRAYLPIMAKSG